MLMAIARLFRDRYPRRFHGECQRCQRLDYLPWATEHGVRYCGQCWEADALAYAKALSSVSKSDKLSAVGRREGQRIEERQVDGNAWLIFFVLLAIGSAFPIFIAVALAWLIVAWITRN